MKRNIATRRGDAAAGFRPPAGLLAGSRTAAHDPRWPALAEALAALRERGRHAVRIVDADCAAGSLLLHAVSHARMLGFTAIEGRGIDGSPALIGRARAAAARLRDSAIGIEFELADMVAALTAEFDLPADIVLWHGVNDEDRRGALAASLLRAGDVVLGDAGRLATAKEAA